MKLSIAALLLTASIVWANPQAAKAPAPAAPAQDSTPAPNRGQAYYHYSLAHMYEEMAMAYNRPDYANKAIDQLRQAMKYDPTSTFLPVELAEMYAKTGRKSDAVAEAEDLVKRDPKNLDARRLLGNLYASTLGEPTLGTRREAQTANLNKAIEQFQRITELDPKDADSLYTLGRLYNFNNDSVKAEASFKKALAVDPDNFDAMVALAELYSQLGQSEKSTELLERASARSQHPRLLAMLGQSYEQSRQYAKAVEVFKKALEQDKDNLDLKRSLAENLLKNDQTDEALKEFLEIAEADPQDANTYLRLGQIYRVKRMFPKSLEAFKKAQVLAPDSMEITYNVALLQETMDAPDEAIRLLRKLVDDTSKPAGSPQEYTAREKQNRAIFLERLGFLYRTKEKYAESEAAFRQMMEMDPENAARGEIHVMDTLRQARQYDKARKEADEAVKKHPNDKTLKMARATLLADMGQVDQGVAEIKALLAAKNKPVATDPEKVEQDKAERREMYLSLSQIQEHARRFDDAIASVKAAGELSSGKEEEEAIFFTLGSVYERAHKIEDAEQNFRKALAINPDSSLALNYLGYMLADHGVRLDEAVKMITRALELEPQSGAIMDSLGWAYFKQNRFDLAEQYLLKAVQKQSKDATIRDHLADLYFKTNRTKQALQEWTTALAEWEHTLPGDTDPLDVAKVQKKLEDAKVKLAKENGTVK
jgi:tetratricopeptide (TPR) repeat protein